MEAIYPISSLQKEQSDVKKAATRDLVRITENGRAAYIFCSEDVFESRLESARAEARTEILLRQIIQRSDEDIATGRVYTSTEAARKALNERLDNR